MITDPHDSGSRMEPFQKDCSLERDLLEFNRHLETLEFDAESDGEKSYPVIYVVGLPRSGTTLLSQLISRYLSVGYINNIIARFWLNPVAGIRVSEAVLGTNARERIRLESTHGVTDDPWGPHEFGYFWRHWLRLDEANTHKLPCDVLARIDKAGLSLALGRIVGAFGKPVVFKNIICGLQAAFLSELRPNSLFVIIERAPRAVAQSLLRSRGARYGDTSVWWSLKPSTFEDIYKIGTPEEQIERQISDGTADFLEELAKPGVNSIRLSYEALCENPVKSLQQIVIAAESMGCSMQLLGMPEKLKVSNG